VSGAWTCGSCGRQVPGAVGRCRCGSIRPIAWQGEDDDPPELAERLKSIVTPIAVIAVAAAGIFFWYHSRSAAPGAPAPRGPALGAAFPSGTAPLSAPVTPAAADAGDKPPVVANADPPTTLEDMVAAATPAVVMLETPDTRGTGFFVKRDVIVTNAHVIRGATTVKLKFADGRSGTAIVSSVGEGVDLALLQPNPGSEGSTILELSSVGHVRAGQEVVAIGSAMGVLQNTVTRGIVSAMRQDGRVMLIQTDAAINPGNSGGPLLDRTGHVIGVNTMKLGAAASIGFALAADHVRTLIDAPPNPPPAFPSESQPPAAFTDPPSAPGADDAHAQALADFELQLKKISGRADQIDDYWERFKRACNVAAGAKHGDREWFGVWSQRPDVQANIADCSVWLSDVVQISSAVRNAIVAGDESARRAGILPGQVRTLRHKYRLEWDGWDREK
jgi:S1-C subfamily serine protease